MQILTGHNLNFVYAQIFSTHFNWTKSYCDEAHTLAGQRLILIKHTL